MRACFIKFWLEDVIGKDHVAEYYFVVYFMVLSVSWVFPGGKMWPGHAADHSPPSSAMVMEE